VTVAWGIILIPALLISVFVVFVVAGVSGGMVSFTIARKRYRRMAG
jgi:hypothetical protein